MGFLGISLLNFFIFILNDQSREATAINVAGRQRMLSQKMTKEAILISSLADDVERKRLGELFSRTHAMFFNSLTALLKGGEVEKMGILDPPQSREVNSAAQELKTIWEQFDPHCRIIMDPAAQQAAVQKAAAEMVRTNEAVLDKANVLTSALTQDSHAKAQRMWFFQLGGNVAILALIAAAFFFINVPMGRRLRKITDIADEFADGVTQKSALDALQAKDEIGELAAAFSKMQALQMDRIAMAENIAGGDLRHMISIASEADTFGKALVQMTMELNRIILSVRQTAKIVAQRSIELSDSSQSLSQGATEQAATLEEISSSMEEISIQNKTSADHAEQANQLAATARTAAEKGNALMQKMVQAMEGINASSKEISKIIKVIDDIAFQTNLLALNAAVEAARAGRHGKGFAVVAQEVRSLAARSAKAAQETTALIEGSIQRVADGSQIAKQTAESLNEIAEGVHKVTDLVGEIAASSKEQALGSAQVNHGLTQLSQITQLNADTSEKTANSSTELSNQAVSVSRILDGFKLQGTEEEMIPAFKKTVPQPGRKVKMLGAK